MWVGVNERGEDGFWEGLGLFVLDLWFVCIKANEQATGLIWKAAVSDLKLGYKIFWPQLMVRAL